MLTKFGKALRTIRLERDELLKDMAKNLGITPSFLSSIESGKKNVPTALIDKITQIYNLTQNEKRQLEMFAKEAKSKVQISLKDKSNKEREIVTLFARTFEELDETDKEKIWDILKGSGNIGSSKTGNG
jgi:HTH-type transcriptional regulator, competence development regulator